MRRIVACLVVALALGASSVAAQGVRRLNYDDIYCSGNVTNENIPYDLYLISGEESSPQTVFSQGNLVFINRGTSGGVNIGDEFLVMRPVKDPARFKWFESQPQLARAMGTQWSDIGRLKVVAVYDNTATARVIHTCDFLQRGDYVRPIAARPAPEPKREEAFDLFPKPTGRPLAMVVNSKNYSRVVGTYDIIYVNLGSGQGVKDGDYFRIFRYQGTNHDTVYQVRNRQYMMFGFGSTPVRYTWKDLPREMLGEGIVLRVADNAAVVMITYAVKEIFMGDYVELKDPAARAAVMPAAAVETAPPMNRPPTLTVSTDRPSVLAGERARITGRGADPDGDVLTYSWRTSGGQVLGTGAFVQLDTSGLAPGRYMVTGHVDDGRGGVVDASTTLEVVVQAAAQASQAGELMFGPNSARLDNVVKRLLDDVALRMQSEPGGNVVLIGYGDAAEANPGRLAAQRAENAKAYLLNKGIASSRVSTRTGAATEAGAGRQNRRVDVIWVPEGATY